MLGWLRLGESVGPAIVEEIAGQMRAAHQLHGGNPCLTSPRNGPTALSFICPGLSFPTSSVVEITRLSTHPEFSKVSDMETEMVTVATHGSGPPEQASATVLRALTVTLS